MGFFKVIWNKVLPVLGLVALVYGVWGWYEGYVTYPWESYVTDREEREDLRIASPDGKLEAVMTAELRGGDHFYYQLYIENPAQPAEYVAYAFSIFGWPRIDRPAPSWNEVIAQDIIAIEWEANDLLEVTYCGIPISGQNYATGYGVDTLRVDLNFVRRGDCDSTVLDRNGFYTAELE